jgi:predicted ribosome quality control (RQC) complex YloA/Tae2 family protein
MENLGKSIFKNEPTIESQKPKDLKIDPKVFGTDAWKDNTFITTYLSFKQNGLSIIKKSFDMKKVPDDVDDAEFDMAEFYDKDPEVEEIMVPKEKALEMLQAERENLQTHIEELKKDLKENEDDELTYRRIDDLIYESKDDLGKIDIFISTINKL